jgi:hypothetical protein
MALLVPNAGEGLMLEHIVGKTAVEALTLKLYKNNYTPVEASVAGSFTEADFTGYSAASLVGASWTITTGDPSYASYAQQTFTSNAGSQNQPVYGYFIIGASSGTIYWAELFIDGPYTIVNNGDAIKVTPRIELA